MKPLLLAAALALASCASVQANEAGPTAGLGQLAIVQKKLRLRQQAISNISQQIGAISNTISQSNNEIVRLREELDTLKIQYEKSIVYAYKNRSNYDFLNFIFSAASFNDALKRIEYLKSYRIYREEQAANIKKTQEVLQQKISSLRATREEKDKILEKQEKEKEVLVHEKREKDEIVNKLRTPLFLQLRSRRILCLYRK